ncbi:MAG TPA: hypothetical protein VH479_02225 [Acidimicrobiales bacterium]|jgi:hypothetical protein
MTSLDDRLRDLIRSGGPDTERLQGDVTEVRALTRRRARRRRAVAGALGSVVVVLGVAGVVWAGAGRGPNVVSDDTTLPQAPPSTVPTTVAPPRPSIRDVDFGELTYDSVCDGRSATLTGGIATLPDTDESRYDVTLGAVGYADADGDGEEDALVSLQCTFIGAETDSTLQLRVYGIGAGGGAELIGSPKDLEHDANSSIEGMTATVILDRPGEGDPICCSDRFREVWRFDGSGFVLDSSTQVPQPGAS